MVKAKWIVIEDEGGERKRFNLASMTVIWEGHKEVGTGVYREAIYLMPRARKVIVKAYSIWENPRTHGCYGTSYVIADAGLLAMLASQTGDERLLNLVPVGEA